CFVPRAGPTVKLVDFLRSLAEETCPQHIAEEVVIAIPKTVIVERHDKQVRPLQRLERGPAGGASDDSITERRSHVAENRGSEQEVADLVGLTLEYLFDEVVHDKAVVTGEVGDEAGYVVTTLKRQRGELQCRDPSFGASLERTDVVLGEVET